MSVVGAIPLSFFSLAVVWKSIDAEMRVRLGKYSDAHLEGAEQSGANIQTLSESADQGFSELESPNDPERCGDEHALTAYEHSQSFVARKLRFPETAQFPDSRKEVGIFPLGDCRFRVEAYVHAQNGVGDYVNMNYVAILHFAPELQSWTLKGLELD